ncbi:MAG: ubiquitin-like small modifier protein 1 [Dehalococcoidia bacterium]
MGLVRLYATLRAHAGGEGAVEVLWSPGDAVVGVIRELVRLRPGLDGYILDKEGDLLPFVSVFVDGRDIRHLDGLPTPVGGDAEISVFPPVAGG